jgi:hypothetical protein
MKKEDTEKMVCPRCLGTGTVRTYSPDGGIYQEACGLCHVNDALFRPSEEYIGPSFEECKKVISELLKQP